MPGRYGLTYTHALVSQLTDLTEAANPLSVRNSLNTSA